ncbi:MAG: short-chain dehydrogenase/reductase [Pedosphaera sp.]|nr:short-chain dehydrogenase/reductase [Pedosphaera sp.]
MYMHTTPSKKVALITGASSGIGCETARMLAKRGFRVFGTARDPRKIAAIPGMHVLPLDVTDQSSVTNGVQSVLQDAGAVHALVNAAGYMVSGGLEETSIEEAQQQFDTNFFGLMRVIQAVLPTMRQQGYGRIVNISSVLGFLPAPYMGIYAATKHAVEGYTETLDHEVRQFGIRALLVEPGFTKTNLGKNSRNTSANLEAYAAQKNRVAEGVQRNIAQGDDAGIVAEAVYEALTAKAPSLRYPTGKGVTLSRLRRFVPSKMFDKSFRKQFHLDESL